VVLREVLMLMDKVSDLHARDFFLIYLPLRPTMVEVDDDIIGLCRIGVPSQG